MSSYLNEMTMNSQCWAKTRGRIHARWSMLSDDQIDSVRNNLSLLKVELRNSYGYTQDLAKDEYRDFLGFNNLSATAK